MKKRNCFSDHTLRDNDKQVEGWHLDTGATNHMTRHGNAFAELDHTIISTVQFSDGSIVKICGMGTIIFTGKNSDNAFAELDHRIIGTVQFSDGSIVKICGMGTIIFTGKNSEHKALSGVHYIPRLKNSIISICQLDENACGLIRRRVLRIWDQQG